MFQLQKKIPSPQKLRKMLPLDEETKRIKQNCDIELAQVIADKSRLLVVTGPCAADDYKAVSEYCVKLKALYDVVEDNILLVPRIFTAKPRSLGEGYLGMLFCERTEGDVNIERGLEDCRSLFINCLMQTRLPIADELLYPQQYDYFSDLVSYYFLGARTSESTPHRNFASGMDAAVGIKNNTSGNLQALSQSLRCVETSKTIFREDNQLVTSGNALAHAVLRGYTLNGKHYNNCNEQTFEVLEKLRALYQIKNNFVLVDCSHSNSGKNPKMQIQNALNAVRDFFPSKIGGIMLESYLEEGSSQELYGCSKTDACLSFEDTKELILRLNEMVKERPKD